MRRYILLTCMRRNIRLTCMRRNILLTCISIRPNRLPSSQTFAWKEHDVKVVGCLTFLKAS
jgi:hypothetical protein